MGCPFRTETADNNENIELLWMLKLDIHKCGQNPVKVYVHKFKTEMQKMMDDFCAKYATTYNSISRVGVFRASVHSSVFVNICYCLTFNYNVYPFI